MERDINAMLSGEAPQVRASTNIAVETISAPALNAISNAVQRAAPPPVVHLLRESERTAFLDSVQRCFRTAVTTARNKREVYSKLEKIVASDVGYPKSFYAKPKLTVAPSSPGYAQHKADLERAASEDAKKRANLTLQQRKREADEADANATFPKAWQSAIAKQGWKAIYEDPQHPARPHGFAGYLDEQLKPAAEELCKQVAVDLAIRSYNYQHERAEQQKANAAARLQAQVNKHESLNLVICRGVTQSLQQLVQRNALVVDNQQRISIRPDFDINSVAEQAAKTLVDRVDPAQAQQLREARQIASSPRRNPQSSPHRSPRRKSPIRDQQGSAQQQQQQPKRRGRPPGSRNKPRASDAPSRRSERLRQHPGRNNVSGNNAGPPQQRGRQQPQPRRSQSTNAADNRPRSGNGQSRGRNQERQQQSTRRQQAPRSRGNSTARPNAGRQTPRIRSSSAPPGTSTGGRPAGAATRGNGGGSRQARR
jgi:hypothetical protein